MKSSTLATALVAFTASLSAAPIAYNNISAWNSAVIGLQQNTIDFTNITISDQNMWGYTEDGARFTGTASNGTQYLYGRPSGGGFIYGSFGPGTLQVDLPIGTFGVGFDMGRFYGLVHPTDFIFSDGTVVTMTASSGFIGFTDVDCITYVTIRVRSGGPAGSFGYTSDSPIVYNAYLAVDPSKTADTPEPATSAFVALSSIAGLLWRRRRTKSNQ